jgi:hypothetical protein
VRVKGGEHFLAKEIYIGKVKSKGPTAQKEKT